MLGFLLIVAIAIADRLTKALALAKPLAAMPLIGKALTFESGINKLGPLGLNIPLFLFFSLSIVLSTILIVLVWSESSASNRALLLGAFFGVVSNSYDRLQYGHIIDTLKLVGSLSFNLADLLIVVGLMGVVIKYRWPGRLI